MNTPLIACLLFVPPYLLCCLYMLRGLRFRTRDLCICAIMVAITMILDCIYIPLPTGSSIPLLSPVPLMVLALVLDKRLAIISGWICGFLCIFMVPGWQPVHWGQIFVEHMVCFSCLGFTAAFGTDRRTKILFGIILATLLKFCGHLFSGALFFSQNAWDGWGAWGYSFWYNLSSTLPLMAICGIIVLALPLNNMRRAFVKE